MLLQNKHRTRHCWDLVVLCDSSVSAGYSEILKTSACAGDQVCLNTSSAIELLLVSSQGGCLCRGLAGATPQTIREMFSAAIAPARPAAAVLAASDDEDLDAEYRAKQPKGPFVSPCRPLTPSVFPECLLPQDAWSAAVDVVVVKDRHTWGHT